MVKGNIHSVETMGTVDGPGIRYIVFTQGCMLRCKYCHNADTWDYNTGKTLTADEVLEDALKYRSFWETSGGGITISGGEPLLQIPFVTEIFKRCKELGVHTTIDSCGGSFSDRPEFLANLDELLAHTDLILLDLKHFDRAKHKKLTGVYNDHIKKFAEYLSEKGVPVWIRHVLVPGWTDFDEDLTKLGEYIGTLKNVQKIEVLPYHKLGAYKWEVLGLDYPLKDVEPPTDERVENAYNLLTRHWKRP